MNKDGWFWRPRFGIGDAFFVGLGWIIAEVIW